jgi:hypothetical protein
MVVLVNEKSEGSMNKKWHFPLLTVGLLALASLACNFPFVPSPTPFGFPTPDMTMTAIFNPTVTSRPVIFPTQTIPPAWASPTYTQAGQLPSPIPTDTALPPTATATRTATPTKSYAGPDKRPKFSMTGFYFSTPPNIDGRLGEWKQDRYLIENVVFGKGNHSGSEDLSGRAMISWDGTNLYLGIRVIDDKYIQNAKGTNLFKGDSLDILLDSDVPSDFYLDTLNGDDFQLGISPGSPGPNDNPEAYLWFPKSSEGARGEVTIASRNREDGYIVEAAIPWSIFDVSPKTGQHFGFAFSISDNDNRNQNIQQSMVSYVPIRTLSDPTTWGDLTLVKP